MRYDVVIIGLGAMGSATAWELARRGRRVLALERFGPAHAYGSSHGKSRIIREAYYEHPLYVPLVQAAYERWAELEREAGTTLFHRTGGIMIGPSDGALVSGARRTAHEHQLPHEEITAAEVRRRFPALVPSNDMVGLWEPRAGALHPEQCIEAFIRGARERGATLRFGEAARSWSADDTGVAVQTETEVFRADRLVLGAGPWLPKLLPELAHTLAVARQVFHWFEPVVADGRFLAGAYPVSMWEEPASGRMFYSIPDFGDGVKLAIHHEGALVDPDTVDRMVAPHETEALRAFMRRYVPTLNGRLVSTSVCLYTNTPDRHFLIDRHPTKPNVVIASPCSGHGFKFASIVGSLVADLATNETPPFDLTPFRGAGRLW